MTEINEIQTMTTPKGVYNSFPDLTARAEIEELRKNGGGGSGQNPNGGLSATEKNLMLALFKAVPYTSDVSATMKSLEAIWNSGAGGDEGSDAPGVTYYAVTYNLTSVTADNSPASIIEGGSLTVNLTPDTNAVLSEVIVTMGGVDVTADVYSNGKISISSVTGNVVITAVAAVASYTQVEYLETVGKAYIDTEYALAANDVVEVEFLATGGWNYIFSANNYSFATSTNAGNYFSRLDRGASRSFSSANPDKGISLNGTTGPWTFVETQPGTAVVYDADGGEVVTLTDTDASTFTGSSRSVILFVQAGPPGAIPGNGVGSGKRIYSFKVKNVYGNLVADIIPVLDAEGVACMYDKISGEYLYCGNQSDADYFIAGGAV